MDRTSWLQQTFHNQPRSRALGQPPLISSCLLGPPLLPDLLVPFRPGCPAEFRFALPSTSPTTPPAPDGCAVPGRAAHSQNIPAPQQGCPWSTGSLMSPAPLSLPSACVELTLWYSSKNFCSSSSDTLKCSDLSPPLTSREREASVTRAAHHVRRHLPPPWHVQPDVPQACSTEGVEWDEQRAEDSKHMSTSQNQGLLQEQYRIHIDEGMINETLL